MKVTAKLKNYRVSPRKVRLVADLIKGLPVSRALFQLDNSSKKTAIQIKKLLLSATANAVNNEKASHENLQIADVIVGEGITYKRWMPRAYGRATPIMKRTSNIVITLDADKAKGDQSRKSASSKDSEQEKKHAESDVVEEKKTVKKKQEFVKPKKKEMKKTTNTSSAKEKMFRRKSV